MRSGAETSVFKTQESSDGGYPFHWTRYCRVLFLPKRHDCRILSISHSSSPSRSSGGGLMYAGLCDAMWMNGDRRSTWNVGWIFIDSGNVSRYVTGESFTATLKGP